ncbi:MAG: hypothetical protein KAV82_16945, partial [Phycisphaerae bacterium]|nr:hypothetical protein [Phycisphaerae bacterium]
ERLIVASMMVANAESMGVTELTAKWAINRFLTDRHKVAMMRKAFAVWPFSQVDVDKEKAQLQAEYGSWTDDLDWPFGDGLPEILSDYNKLLADTAAGRRAFAMSQFLKGVDVPPTELPENLTPEEVEQAKAEHEEAKKLAPAGKDGGMVPMLVAIFIMWWLARGRR